MNVWIGVKQEWLDSTATRAAPARCCLFVMVPFPHLSLDSSQHVVMVSFVGRSLLLKAVPSCALSASLVLYSWTVTCSTDAFKEEKERKKKNLGKVSGWTCQPVSRLQHLTQISFWSPYWLFSQRAWNQFQAPITTHGGWWKKKDKVSITCFFLRWKLWGVSLKDTENYRGLLNCAMKL